MRFDDLADRVSHIRELLRKLAGCEEVNAWLDKVRTDDDRQKSVPILNVLDRVSIRLRSDSTLRRNIGRRCPTHKFKLPSSGATLGVIGRSLIYVVPQKPTAKAAVYTAPERSMP